MNYDDKHKWEQREVPDRLKDTFSKYHVCVRGECACERYYTAQYIQGKKFDYYSYWRSGIHYDTAPLCYGDISLSKQPID